MECKEMGVTDCHVGLRPPRNDKEGSCVVVSFFTVTTDEKGDSMQYYVYLLTNKLNTVLYVGVTNDLERRLFEHRNELVDSFTKRYHVHKLVYYEATSDVRAAIEREKQIKSWSRAKKNALVNTMNPKWKDLSLEWE